MKCERSEELWSDGLEGNLAPHLRKDLEEHLASCSACSSLFGHFEDVVAALASLPRPAPRPGLHGSILAATLPELRRRRGERFSPAVVPARGRWTLWAAAAVFVFGLFLRPPAALSDLTSRLKLVGARTYSHGLRLYGEAERLVEELNVLRMTVGVAFEDRWDRLQERLRDLEQAQRRNEPEADKSSGLEPISRWSLDVSAGSPNQQPRSRT